MSIEDGKKMMIKGVGSGFSEAMLGCDSAEEEEEDSGLELGVRPLSTDDSNPPSPKAPKKRPSSAAAEPPAPVRKRPASAADLAEAKQKKKEAQDAAREEKEAAEKLNNEKTQEARKF